MTACVDRSPPLPRGGQGRGQFRTASQFKGVVVSKYLLSNELKNKNKNLKFPLRSSVCVSVCFRCDIVSWTRQCRGGEGWETTSTPQTGFQSDSTHVISSRSVLSPGICSGMTCRLHVRVWWLSLSGRGGVGEELGGRGRWGRGGGSCTLHKITGE